jgi:hypothetical protein
MKIMTEPRDVDPARHAILDAGYKGERVVLMGTSDGAPRPVSPRPQPRFLAIRGVAREFLTALSGKKVTRPSEA